MFIYNVCKNREKEGWGEEERERIFMQLTS